MTSAIWCCGDRVAAVENVGTLLWSRDGLDLVCEKRQLVVNAIDHEFLVNPVAYSYVNVRWEWVELRQVGISVRVGHRRPCSTLNFCPRQCPSGTKIGLGTAGPTKCRPSTSMG